MELPPQAGRRIRPWVLATVALTVVALGYVVTLPFRQTRFQVVEHELVASEGRPAIRGVVRNRGEGAREVLVEAYLYGASNRYLGTVTTVLPSVGEGDRPFEIPLAGGAPGRITRYSLYVGLEPNPFAPDR